MKKLFVLAPVVGLIGLSSLMFDHPALADKDDGEKGEQEIAFKQLPASVKRALKNIKVGQISEIEKEKTKGGSTVYEVELRVGKHEVELKLSADGKLLSVEIESEDDDDDDKKGSKDKDDDD